jgi:hypothetical protein
MSFIGVTPQVALNKSSPQQECFRLNSSVPPHAVVITVGLIPNFAISKRLYLGRLILSMDVHVEYRCSYLIRIPLVEVGYILLILLCGTLVMGSGVQLKGVAIRQTIKKA